ncbi:MAG: CBS domain-containing protein [Alphaproteobacteria bacterium]|nr:CBS domain-containing protein [Alphaproteobacteria bacterium]
MPCRHAMIENKIITANPQTTIEEALKLFNTHKIRSVPVVDENNNLLGLFSFHQLLMTILPIPMAVGKGLHILDISLDHISGQSKWLSDRLKKHLDRKINEIMSKSPKTVHLDTPIGEGVRLLAHYGSPIAVTEEESNKLVGLISSQSVIKLLLNIEKD